MLGVIMLSAVTVRITTLNDVLYAVFHYAERQYNQQYRQFCYCWVSLQCLVLLYCTLLCKVLSDCIVSVMQSVILLSESIVCLDMLGVMLGVVTCNA